MYNLSETLLISHNFSRALGSIDENGSAFVPSGVVTIGDCALSRTLLIGDMQWSDKVTLAFDPVTADTFRLRLYWSVSLHMMSGSSFSAYICRGCEVGSSQHEMAKALSVLRSEIDEHHILFTKGMMSVITDAKPVVAK